MLNPAFKILLRGGKLLSSQFVVQSWDQLHHQSRGSLPGRRPGFQFGFSFDHRAHQLQGSTRCRYADSRTSFSVAVKARCVHGETLLPEKEDLGGADMIDGV